MVSYQYESIGRPFRPKPLGLLLIGVRVGSGPCKDA